MKFATASSILQLRSPPFFMHPFNGKPISAIKYNQECRNEEKAEINYIDGIKERNAESF